MTVAELIFFIMEILLILINVFCLGRYCYPKNMQKIIDDSDNTILKVLSEWTYKFVVEAKNTMKQDNGEKKKQKVITNLKNLCEKWNLKLTDEQISALIEDAYDTMKSIDQSSTEK